MLCGPDIRRPVHAGPHIELLRMLPTKRMYFRCRGFEPECPARSIQAYQDPVLQSAPQLKFRLFALPLLSDQLQALSIGGDGKLRKPALELRRIEQVVLLIAG